ncbi:MAG: SLBB domain-containing protein, partial [Syntrophothermus sp.]
MKKISILLLMFFVLTVNIFPQSIDSKISQSIMGANTISVTVGGNFIVTGTFPAFINDRVDQFVTRLYNNSKEALLSEATAAYMRKALEKDFAKYSFRNITLKRASGEEFKLDLLKFRKTGDFKNNPYLKNDDVLIFPTTDLERNFFTVSGAVNAPGKFHFMEGDKLKDAIELAEGINKAYEKVQFAEINRLSYDGERIEVVKVSIDENVALQRGDRIVVVANETQRKEFSVTVIGEVNIPGTIPITKNNSTLKEVFERAGGLKENASLNRVKLYDNSIFNFLAYRENTEDLLEKSSTSY